MQPNLNHTEMFKVKHAKNNVTSFDGTMELEEVLKLNGMARLIIYLLSKNENFYLIMGLGGEEWTINFTV